MKKLLSLGMIAGTLALTTPAAQAATVAGNFNVTASVTAVCTMAAIGDLAFGTYTAFQAGNLAATPTSAVLTCTRGLTGVGAYFDHDGTNTINTAGATTPATSPTGAGVVTGLNYTITATRNATAAGTPADATTTGTAATWTYAITGDIGGGQAGTCATGTCAGTQARTLTVSY